MRREKAARTTPRAAASSAPTATRPATAWCRCRSLCRCRTTSVPRARPSSSRARWASTRPCSCMPRRWAPTSPSSSSTAASTHLVDLDEVHVVEREYPLLTRQGRQPRDQKQLRRKLVVVGACIGTDAHTVGIDAILNIKGFAGEKGLEYYREIRVVNLGAQVLVPDLVARARAEKADAVLVSQVVTQKDAHIHNTTADVRGLPRGLPRRAACRSSSPAARASRRAPSSPRRRPHLRAGHDAR